jgi:cyclic 2,3-diphosphoglycerate synthetase
LPYEFVGALLVGGTEKLRGVGEDDYGVPLAADLAAALADLDPDVVVDVSDEPVLGPVARFRIASRVLARGLPYVGPDFRLAPPTFEPFPLPSLSVIGTGKRVGKTALVTHLTRLLAAEREVVVVAMGRGGPDEPEVLETAPTLDALIALSRAGRHAASDYLEVATLTGAVTIGCTRCGGGLAGAPATSNVAAGAKLAAERSPDLVLFDGSGAAIPGVATDRRILVAAAEQGPELVTGYLNAYRVLISDLVVVTMAEEGSRHEEVARAIAELKPDVPVITAVLRPRPVTPIAGRRVAFFATAPAAAHPPLASHLEERHGAQVVHVSGNLANREALRRELERLDADAYLVEIKAAAIDVVVEAALERGADVVFAETELQPLPGQPDLDTELRALAESMTTVPAGP